MAEALLSASAHVYRQMHAGKHEQDRKDAVEWCQSNADLLDSLRRTGGKIPRRPRKRMAKKEPLDFEKTVAEVLDACRDATRK